MRNYEVVHLLEKGRMPRYDEIKQILECGTHSEIKKLLRRVALPEDLESFLFEKAKESSFGLMPGSICYPFWGKVLNLYTRWHGLSVNLQMKIYDLPDEPFGDLNGYREMLLSYLPAGMTDEEYKCLIMTQNGDLENVLCNWKSNIEILNVYLDCRKNSKEVYWERAAEAIDEMYFPLTIPAPLVKRVMTLKNSTSDLIEEVKKEIKKHQEEEV